GLVLLRGTLTLQWVVTGHGSDGLFDLALGVFDHSLDASLWAAVLVRHCRVHPPRSCAPQPRICLPPHRATEAQHSQFLRIPHPVLSARTPEETSPPPHHRRRATGTPRWVGRAVAQGDRGVRFAVDPQDVSAGDVSAGPRRVTLLRPGGDRRRGWRRRLGLTGLTGVLLLCRQPALIARHLGCLVRPPVHRLWAVLGPRAVLRGLAAPQNLVIRRLIV